MPRETFFFCWSEEYIHHNHFYHHNFPKHPKNEYNGCILQTNRRKKLRGGISLRTLLSTVGWDLPILDFVPFRAQFSSDFLRMGIIEKVLKHPFRKYFEFNLSIVLEQSYTNYPNYFWWTPYFAHFQLCSTIWVIWYDVLTFISHGIHKLEAETITTKRRIVHKNLTMHSQVTFKLMALATLIGTTYYYYRDSALP